jgi:transcriptional regulator with XRE-family HTH domain
MNLLKLREEDCSAFGRLVLQHLKNNPATNMSQLAKQVGMSRPGLGWICLKRSNPDEETARKIAQVVGVDLTKIARLVHENKLETMANLKELNYVVQVNKEWISRPVPLEDAIAGLNAVFHAFHYITRRIPEVEKPSDFQIYKMTFDVVKKQFLKSGKSIKKPS